MCIYIYIYDNNDNNDSILHYIAIQDFRPTAPAPAWAAAPDAAEVWEDDALSPEDEVGGRGWGRERGRVAWMLPCGSNASPQ